jgi:urease accessory protein
VSAAEDPLWLGAAIIGLFAFFHGHVHGTEAAAASLITYATGLAVATGAFLAAGIAMCCVVGRSIGSVALRTMGPIVAFGGVLAMVALT